MTLAFRALPGENGNSDVVTPAAFGVNPNFCNLIDRHNFGIASKVAETTIACIYERNSATCQFLESVRDAVDIIQPYNISVRAITRTTERQIYGRSLSKCGNNYTCVIVRVDAHGTPTTGANAALTAIQNRFQDNASLALRQLCDEPRVICVCLRTTPLSHCIAPFVAASARPPLLFTGSHTEVGYAPIFSASTGARDQQPTQLVLYGPAGKIKLWPVNMDIGADGSAGALQSAIERLQVYHASTLRAFTYSDCVNYNKREQLNKTHDMPSHTFTKQWIHERLLLQPDVFRVFDAEEGQGAARLEVEITHDNSDFSTQGNINIFMSYPAPGYDPDCRPDEPMPTCVRVNVTGRFTYREAINNLDLVSLAIHADEASVANTEEFTTLAAYIRQRGHIECLQLNRQREIKRVRSNLRRARRDTLAGSTYARPLHIDTQFAAQPTTEGATVRQCSMCQCVHDTGRGTNGTSTALCLHCINLPKESGCPFHINEMKTTYRKVPDSAIYSTQDGPVALALSMACQEQNAALTSATHCCSSCFQQNNRRRVMTQPGSGMPHPNLKVVYNLMFMGHPQAPHLRRRNSIKLLRRYVRIVTSAITTPGDNRVQFVCPPYFRPLLQLMALRWCAARRATHRFPDKPPRDTWTPRATCEFRRWCMTCSEHHWMETVRWVWAQDQTRQQLQDSDQRDVMALVDSSRPQNTLQDTLCLLRDVGFCAPLLQQVRQTFQSTAHTFTHAPAAIAQPETVARVAESLLRMLTAAMLRAARISSHPGMMKVAPAQKLSKLFPLSRAAERSSTHAKFLLAAVQSGAIQLDAPALLARAVYICESAQPGSDGSMSVCAMQFVRQAANDLKRSDAATNCALVQTLLAYAQVMLRCAAPVPTKNNGGRERPAKRRRLSYLSGTNHGPHSWG